jgi:glycerol uptake facilitator-like aquaporin
MKGNGTVLTPVAIGLALTVAIYMVSHAGTHCHFNPAVSFMSWCKGEIPLMVLGMYVIAQLLGGFGAYALHTYIVKG